MEIREIEAQEHAALAELTVAAYRGSHEVLGDRYEAELADVSVRAEESLVLHTIDANVGGLAFYEALGFDRAPELDWEPEPGIRLLGLRIEVAFAG